LKKIGHFKAPEKGNWRGMMTKTCYETKADRKNEEAVSKKVEDFLGVKFYPTPKFFPADFVSGDEKIYLEVRCRDCNMSRHSDFYISATKWIELLRLIFDEINPSVFLAVAFLDNTCLLRIDFTQVNLVPFKRNRSSGTRRDDVMISIPINSLTVIAHSPKLIRSENWMGAGKDE
jgi:hypothetical protein